MKILKKISQHKLDFVRLWSLARSEWKTILLATFFLILSSLMGLLYPQAIRIIIDGSLRDGGNVKIINLTALIMVIIFVFQGIASAFRHYLFTVAGERIVASLKRTLYDNIIIQEIAFFDTKRTGELTNRLSSDTTVLQNTVSLHISMTLKNTASIIGGIVFLFYISSSLALLVLSVIPPIAIASIYFGRLIRILSKEVQDALARAGEIAEETISGIRTVRSFAQEETESQRYGKSIEHSFELSKKRILANAFFMAGTTLIGYGSITFIFWKGGQLVLNKSISVGDLTSFLLYAVSVTFAMSNLGNLWTVFMRALGAAERVFEIINRTPEIPVSQGKTLAKVNGEIAFNQVSFTYPTRPDITVLNDIQFSIKQGQKIALVGSSGGGKSTISSLLLRLYDPQKGDIILDNHNIKELNASWLRKNIAVVSQEPILFSTTIKANILYGRSDATQQQLEEASHAANAHPFIMNFPKQYDTQVGERGIQLSGGQKQRIAIARAILKNPKILLLDEATSALDAESEYLVKEALNRLMQKRTTLIIAHRLSTVKDADIVLVVDNGRIVQIGSHNELFANSDGIYHKLVVRQMLGNE